MVNTDPAIEAARRAESESQWWKFPDAMPWDSDHAEDAAREALAPIRELHKPAIRIADWSSGVRFVDRCPTCHGKAGVHECGCWADSDADVWCQSCGTAWPCPTAKLCYTTEELTA